MEEWLFIDSGNQPPGYNMALDEKLMDWHREKIIPPVVRFYGWKPASLSIGYFQKWEKEIDMDAVSKYGLGFVRRPTGGRGVLHEDELTYSVIVSEAHHAMPETVTEAYRVISEGLLEGFKNLKLDARFSVPESEVEKEKLKNPRSSVCFDAPSWYEMVVEGRKVAGSAQTRQRGIILQHGSIIRSVDSGKLFDLFKYPNPAVKEKMRQAFHKKAVTINELTDEEIPMEIISQAFRTGFETGLNIRLAPYILSSVQHNEVLELACKKYESDRWNYRY